MQWIAILAALGWCVLQVSLLFLWTQCSMALVGYRTVSTEYKFLNSCLVNLILGSFLTLLALPFLSAGLFVYVVVNITSWSQLNPALSVFSTWWIILFVFLLLRSLKEKIPESKH